VECGWKKDSDDLKTLLSQGNDIHPVLIKSLNAMEQLYLRDPKDLKSKV